MSSTTKLGTVKRSGQNVCSCSPTTILVKGWMTMMVTPATKHTKNRTFRYLKSFCRTKPYTGDRDDEYWTRLLGCRKRLKNTSIAVLRVSGLSVWPPTSVWTVSEELLTIQRALVKDMPTRQDNVKSYHQIMISIASFMRQKNLYVSCHKVMQKICKCNKAIISYHQYVKCLLRKFVRPNSHHLDDKCLFYNPHL